MHVSEGAIKADLRAIYSITDRNGRIKTALMASQIMRCLKLRIRPPVGLNADPHRITPEAATKVLCSYVIGTILLALITALGWSLFNGDSDDQNGLA